MLFPHNYLPFGVPGERAELASLRHLVTAAALESDGNTGIPRSSKTCLLAAHAGVESEATTIGFLDSEIIRAMIAPIFSVFCARPQSAR